MRLQYIASACVLVEHQGVRVLCDPWLVDGCYGGAWFHNPPLTVTPEDYADIDAIYLSHIHPDHADFATLERLPRVPVFMASYAEAFFAAKVRALGFHVTEVAPYPDGAIAFGNGLMLQVLPADDCNPELCGRWIGCQIADATPGKSYQIDSIAIFKTDEHVIVNVNDCPYELAKRALARVPQPIDLLCLGYAGAGPWPQCFGHLSPEQKHREALKKKAKFIGQMDDFVEHLQPKAFLPFAGQYTLGGSLVDLNDARGVPELEDLVGDERMVKLNRMAWFDCETGQASEPFQPVSMEQKRAYRETLRDRKLDHEADDWPAHDELSTVIDVAREKWRERCAARGITSDWWIEINGLYPDDEVWCDYITLQGREDLEGPSLVVQVDARLLMRILRRQMNMNNAEIGSLLTFKRTPDVFDRALFNSLSYFHA